MYVDKMHINIQEYRLEKIIRRLLTSIFPAFSPLVRSPPSQAKLSMLLKPAPIPGMALAPGLSPAAIAAAAALSGGQLGGIPMHTRKIEINGAAATARNILTRGSMQVRDWSSLHQLSRAPTDLLRTWTARRRKSAPRRERP